MFPFILFIKFVYNAFAYLIKYIQLKILLAYEKIRPINASERILAEAIKNFFHLTIIRIIINNKDIYRLEEIYKLLQEKIETEFRILKIKYEIEDCSKKSSRIETSTLTKLKRELYNYENNLIQIEASLKQKQIYLHSERIIDERVFQVNNPKNSNNKKVRIVSLCKNCTSVLGSNV